MSTDKRILDGEILLYWSNGQLKRRCHFNQGVREGLDQMWNEEGILVDEGSYFDAKPIGAHRRFSSKGLLIEEIFYLKPNKFNLKQWDENGVLRVECYWIDEKNYEERIWDRFKECWIEKRGIWDTDELVYI